MAVALRSVLSATERPTPYAELVATLGVANSPVAPAAPRTGSAPPAVDLTIDPATWGCFGRDLFLPATARLYGLRLRELHPPSAAAGLQASREFEQHFHDSYAPLIRAALAAGQVALVWRGWPDAQGLAWGLVTEERDGHLLGYRPGGAGESQPLVTPAWQVYIVETADPQPAPLTPDTLLEHALRARAHWFGASDASAGVLHGAAGYRAWRACLDPASPQPRSGLAPAVAEFVGARQVSAEWLAGLEDTLSDSTRSAQAATWRTLLNDTLARLAEFGDVDQLGSLLVDDAGAQQFAAAIDDVAALESRFDPAGLRSA